LDEWEKNKPWIGQSFKDEILNEARQAKTLGYMVPIFTSDEVYGKVEKLQDKVFKISKMPKPKPKVEIPPKK